MDFLGLTAVGVGIVVFGASIGISIIGYATQNNIARQPAKSGDMRVVMIILASLIEGLALFALVITLLIALSEKST